MDYAEKAMELHRKLRGKLEMHTRTETGTREALSIAYTPGVAAPCLAIKEDPAQSYELTRRWNTVAVVTDGTAVLGLGDIGPEAGMPVMEGKCILFKDFGDVDAIPLCIRSKNVDEIVHTVSLLAGSFGGINLEDISAPRCFEIEQKLQEACDIPVFHDDQHGTAIVVSAALINALKLTGKKMETMPEPCLRLYRGRCHRACSVRRELAPQASYAGHHGRHCCRWYHRWCSGCNGLCVRLLHHSGSANLPADHVGNGNRHCCSHRCVCTGHCCTGL